MKGLFAALLLCLPGAAVAADAPVRLAIVGLVHDHVRIILPALVGRKDIKLVGIVEPDAALCGIYEKGFHLTPSLFYPTFDALRAATKVDAVATFTSAYDHRRVVEMCAPLGIDVMMEKPFAVSMDAARAMADAARRGGIQLVINYETTWYPSVRSAHEYIEGGPGIGGIRKIVAHDGHQGPAIIGCSPYFLAWLTDPVLNGGGAIMDFGCYGADLVTWFIHERPLSVFAVTQRLQPKFYPKVDDDATIVITYPHAQAILEPSWDWSYGRKDMEIYGATASLSLPNGDSIFVRTGDSPEAALPAPAIPAPEGDYLSYLVAVVRGRITPSGLSSVETNLVATEILDAARQSARTGKSVAIPAD
ncbi:MAG TPA: Gfo/Idh/MocA family oxidoreductase [Opitutaceae bacterium]|jgi:predicted dehydrogenase